MSVTVRRKGSNLCLCKQRTRLHTRSNVLHLYHEKAAIPNLLGPSGGRGGDHSLAELGLGQRRFPSKHEHQVRLDALAGFSAESTVGAQQLHADGGVLFDVGQGVRTFEGE